jgi:hypothetical protein
VASSRPASTSCDPVGTFSASASIASSERESVTSCTSSRTRTIGVETEASAEPSRGTAADQSESLPAAIARKTFSSIGSTAFSADAM